MDKPQCGMRGAVEVGIKALGTEKSGQQFWLRSGNKAGSGETAKRGDLGVPGGHSRLSV